MSKLDAPANTAAIFDSWSSNEDDFYGFSCRIPLGNSVSNGRRLRRERETMYFIDVHIK